MTRICLLTTSFPRFKDDEASVFLQRLIEGYSECGASGVIIVPRDSDEEEVARCSNFEIHRFRYGIFLKGALAFGAGIMPNLRRRPFLILQAPLLFLQLIWQSYRHREEYDVIHANWTLALLAAWVISLISRKPYIVTMRGEDIPLLKNPLLSIFCRAALARASCVVTVNQQFMLDLQNFSGIDAAKCLVVPNGVSMVELPQPEISKFSTMHGIAGKKVLLFVGTVIPRKRIEVLVQSLSLPKIKDYHLVVCGRLDDSVYVEKLKDLAQRLEVEKRLLLIGAVPPSQIPYYLHAASAYLTASSFEGRPNAVLEALAAGKIVLASNIAAHAEIIKHEKNGFLFDPNFPQQIEQFLSAIEQSPKRMQNIQEAAHISVQGLSWESCAKEYLRLLNQALVRQDQGKENH